jgi:hypothetical protein
MALGWPPGASYGVPFPRRPVATVCSLVSRAAIISRWSKSSRSRSQHRVHSQGDCPQPCKANAADGGRPGHKAVSMTVPPGGGSPFGPWYRHGASHYASGFYFSRCISPSASAQIRNVFAAASPYSFMPGGPPEYAAHLGNRVPTYLRATLAASSNVCTVTPCLS